MTEEEAKTKWCPFARGVHTQDPTLKTYDGNQPAINRVNGPNGGISVAFCIGSPCMAWRWGSDDRALVTSTSHPDNSPFETNDAEAYRNNPAWRVEALPSEGFCGLAGQP